MHRVLKSVVMLATVAAISAPAVARADGYVSPFIGQNFGNNSGDGRVNFGADAGWMGAGVMGFEVDFGYAPNFFGDQGVFGANSETSLMGNIIVGVPVGGQHGLGVRPYGTIGAGLLRTQITPAIGNAFGDNEAGVNLGGGVMGYFSDHVGIRGDVRYFRNLTGDSVVNDFNVDFGAFHFWRASVGVVFRP